MPRKPREDHAGAFYHISNRGVARRTLFEREHDFRFFVATLIGATQEGWIELHAYCLMFNHFHLLVRSLGALSQAMRWVLLAHSKRFNRMRNRDGPLFKGRFWSRRLIDASDFFNVLRYIDHNPVEAGLVRRIFDHPFGSAQHYVEAEGPRWLSRSAVEGEIRRRAGDTEYDPASYVELLDSDLSEHIAWNVERRVHHPTHTRDPLEELVSGSEDVAQEWMRTTAKLADGVASVPLLAPGPVVALVEHYRGSADWTVFASRRALNGWDVIAAGMLRHVCGLSFSEIAARLGTDATTAMRRVRQHARLLATDGGYAKRAAGILHRELDAYRVGIAPVPGQGFAPTQANILTK